MFSFLLLAFIILYTLHTFIDLTVLLFHLEGSIIFIHLVLVELYFPLRSCFEKSFILYCTLLQSNVLKNTNPAFKRALANKMFAEIYTAGEIIYAQDKVKNILMYVATGSVQILSGDDTESTLLILGMGSCLGDISLIYSLENPVQVSVSPRIHGTKYKSQFPRLNN